jgi:peptidoglycan/xylan/chitin deacetylase (PgdA/CDA1 family)
MMLRELLNRAELRLMRQARRRLRRDGGIVSFTFDDFPRSALAVGGRILAERGLAGTFYTAMGIRGTATEIGSIFEDEDLDRALAEGHELACHTYSHLDCAAVRADELHADLTRNAEALVARTGGLVPASFAYPYGRLSPVAKRAVIGRFDTARGVRSGINAGDIDLGELRANRLYAASFDSSHLAALIAENCRRGGWLIFYTHDVAASPSPFGCTPQQFEWVVDCAARRSPIEPTSRALASLQAG